MRTFDYTCDEAIKAIIDSFKEDGTPDVYEEFKKGIEATYGKEFDSWEQAMAYEIADNFGILKRSVEEENPEILFEACMNR